MNIKITYYEAWMKPQISTLFENEYFIPKEEFEKLMERLYEHPLQTEKSIQLVALDGEKVVGFQSFFYWPYVFNQTTYYSLQSGNSLTHPDYRGKGIFKKLLNFVFENSINQSVDFMIGFPVQASYGSFIKNNWINVINLQWYLKLINPCAFLFSKNNLLKKCNSNFKPNSYYPENVFTLNASEVFYEWKNNLKPKQNAYFYYTYTISANQTITFEMKLQTRKKIINEVIIGKVYFNGVAGTETLQIALKQCLKELRKSKCVTFCSIAINEHLTNPNYLEVVTNLSFKKIDKQIYFIVRDLKNNTAIKNKSLWHIGRADIDTW